MIVLRTNGIATAYAAEHPGGVQNGFSRGEAAPVRTLGLKRNAGGNVNEWTMFKAF